MSKSLPKAQLWQISVLSRNVGGLCSNSSSDLPEVSLCLGLELWLWFWSWAWLSQFGGKIVKLC